LKAQTCLNEVNFSFPFHRPGPLSPVHCHASCRSLLPDRQGRGRSATTLCRRVSWPEGGSMNGMGPISALARPRMLYCPPELTGEALARRHRHPRPLLPRKDGRILRNPGSRNKSSPSLPRLPSKIRCPFVHDPLTPPWRIPRARSKARYGAPQLLHMGRRSRHSTDGLISPPCRIAASFSAKTTAFVCGDPRASLPPAVVLRRW